MIHGVTAVGHARVLRARSSVSNGRSATRGLERHGRNRAMGQTAAMRTVAILAFDGVVAVDLIIPADTFGHTRTADGRPGYVVKVCGIAKAVETSVCRMEVKYGLGALRGAHTLIIPGVSDARCNVDQRIIKAIRRAAARGTRIASICSGALVFARTGLLDGQRATTHWAAAEVLQRSHPAITVDATVLYVDNGQMLTSAGGMAGLDLCLHMIRRDYGATVAASAARYAVMPLERSGGQAQFIVHEPPAPNRGESLTETLQWMQRNLKLDLNVAVIAHHAGMSERTLARRFKEQTGLHPPNGSTACESIAHRRCSRPRRCPWSEWLSPSVSRRPSRSARAFERWSVFHRSAIARRSEASRP